MHLPPFHWCGYGYITKFKNKNLTVTDLVCIGGAADGFHHLIDEAVFTGDFKLNLGYKGNSIFGTAINFGRPRWRP